MKNLIAVIIVALVIAFVWFMSNGALDEVTHQGKTKVAGVWVDTAGIEKYNFGTSAMEADMKGDTYCTKCKKITDGKVRVCSHCGQYVK